MQEDFVMITGSEAEHAYTESRTHFFILFYFILYIYIYISSYMTFLVLLEFVSPSAVFKFTLWHFPS